MFLSWSCKDRIKESLLAEGTLLSTAWEELATVSYETGHASGPADVPCIGGLGHKHSWIIETQTSAKHIEGKWQNKQQ
jgi:hypothetical protein